MSLLSAAIFTRLIVTAPSEKIADVYILQLESLKSQLPCLQGCVVYCVHDPSGFRVGSGGGTLNAIDYLLRNDNINLNAERVLIIHSGGDSRRAPLYSLCGKAWTTVNSIIGSALIANPLALLINELSNFCMHLPYCSLVVASSDVMLDISHLHSGPLDFAMDAVSVVSVAEKPQIAKNHGVLVMNIDDTSNAFICSPALNYLQKPSIESMTQEGAIYGGPSDNSFALIDTGVVIFTGEALLKFSSLAELTGVSNCTTRVIESLQKGLSSKADVEKQVLRIELYSDILLALGLLGQTSSDISVYLKRLNVPSLSGPPSSYLSALPVIWNTLREISLHVIHVVSGRFNHLGTTEEVLQLLLQTIEAQKPSDESHGKLSYFAEKYNLRRVVRSIVDSTSLHGGVAINSFASYATWSSASLTEHSLLSACSLGDNAILSHVGSSLGCNLVLNMNTMMQQVFLKEALTSRSSLQSQTVSFSQCALLVMNIMDDVKKGYETVLKKTGVVMGSSWEKLFSVSGVTPDEIWATDIPVADRALWNAKLFSKFRALPSILEDGDSSSVEVLVRGEYKVCSKLTLTWLQDLKNLDRLLRDGQDESLSTAIADWRSSDRVSLSDLLSVGDAKKMFFWRLLLQTAFDFEFGLLQRTSTGQERIDSKHALTYIFECVNDLFKNFELELVSSGVSNSHSAAASAAITLWCLQLLRDLEGSPIDSIYISDALQLLFPRLSPGAIHNILEAFTLFQTRLEQVKNAPESSTLVAEYLKRLLFHQSLLKIARALLHASGSMTTLTHPRVLFLVSWLLKDSDEVGRLFSGHEIFIPSQLKAPANIGSIGDLTGFTQSVIWQVRDRLAVDKAEHIEVGNGSNIAVQSLQSGLESAAQAIVSAHIQHSLEMNKSMTRPQKSRQGANAGVVVVAVSPVRIDLAGGWSDTPPICYEMSGAVLNVAITVDTKHPIRCASRFVSSKTSLRLVTVRDLQDSATDSGAKGFEIIEFRTIQEVQTVFKDTQAWYSLLLAVLIVLGVVDFARSDTTIPDSLKKFLSSDIPYGLEIGFISTLPAGSGMGGSSVLAATILMSVGSLLGLQLSNEDLVHQVSQVEQVLTTGGGWQDQVGAIYGGFKIARSPKLLPLQVSVTPAQVSAAFIDAFQRRTFLVYTGRQRLAKNTLINALRKCALIPVGDPHSTVMALLQGAESGFRLLATQASSPGNCDDTVDSLAATLNEYWALKKEMAAGSEPAHIKSILDDLRPLSEAVSLCGAGAGGFAVVILKRAFSLKDLEVCIEKMNVRAVDADGDGRFPDRKFSIHTVQVDSIGTRTNFFDENEKDVTYYII